MFMGLVGLVSNVRSFFKLAQGELRIEDVDMVLVHESNVGEENGAGVEVATLLVMGRRGYGMFCSSGNRKGDRERGGD